LPAPSPPGVGVGVEAVGVGLGLVLVVPEAAGVDTVGLGEDGDTEAVGDGLRVGDVVGRGERGDEETGGRTGPVEVPPAVGVREVLGDGLVPRLGVVGTGEGDVPVSDVPGAEGRSWAMAVPMSTSSTSSTSAASGREKPRPRRPTPPVPGRVRGVVAGRR
jgi:hypothetical protein